MTANSTTHTGQRRSFWTWHGPGDLYVVLFFAIVGFLIAHFGAKSELVMASFTALTICVSLAYSALRGDSLDKWTPRSAWAIRIAAVATGCWLFFATSTLTIRFTAVVVYAVLYVLCERAVWRRARVDNDLAI